MSGGQRPIRRGPDICGQSGSRLVSPALAIAVRPRPGRRRDGIVLLFILGLLAVFSLVTVTYVVVSRIHKRGTQAEAQIERTGDSPDQLLREAALQVARGTTNPLSVLRPHSLLEDLYGSDGITGSVTATVPPNLNNGQLLNFGVGTLSGVLSGSTFTVPCDNYLAGRVLTMKTGAMAGTSWRIVASSAPPTTAAYTVTVLADGVVAASGATSPVYRTSVASGVLALNAGDQFVINGAPFNGTGFGFDSTAAAAFTPGTSVLLGRLDTTLGAAVGLSCPYALLPNPVFFSPIAANSIPGDTIGYQDVAGPGGADDDYDAVDYQNMLLAMRVVVSNTSDPSYPSRVWIPSLHRPDLINYWANQAGGWSTIQAPLLRKIMLRPLGPLSPALSYSGGIDHPNFTGSNPNFNPITGPWDVDNDGDGVPDSIWVDLGLPVQTGPDGRTYKPLVAILCEDLDGKLNLNAHGNLNQLVFGATNWINGSTASATTFPNSQGPFAGTAGGSVTLPIGQGYGPAEVNLALPFQAGLNVTYNSTTNNEYYYLLNGNPNAITAAGSVALQGRYGELNYAGTSSLSFSPGPGNVSPSPGKSGEPLNSDWPGGATIGYVGTGIAFPANMRPDLNAWLKEFEFPDDHFGRNTSLVPFRLSAFGTPPDLDSDGFIGLDPSGNPFYAGTTGNLAASGESLLFGVGETLDKWNNPYQIDLFHQPLMGSYNVTVGSNNAIVPIDAPFLPTELEQILRFNDADAPSLPNRLTRLAPVLFTGSDPLGTMAIDVAGAAYRRRLVTTDSWDLPVPSVVAKTDAVMASPSAAISPSALYSTLTSVPDSYAPCSGLGLYDLFNQHSVRDRQRGGGANAVTQGNVMIQFGPELSQGLRFDLNRPLGNGRDDQASSPTTAGYGVVDEPQEAQNGEQIWSGTFGSAVAFSNSDNYVPVMSQTLPPNAFARQLYAKNLYVLMMLLLDEQFGDAAFPPSTSVNRYILSTQVAQWAVNAIDFRDRDSIMTGFEFDVFPFTDETGDGNPWDVDLDPGTYDPTTYSQASIQLGVVWGCERPEVLITETLALHDRNTKDLPMDSAGSNHSTAPTSSPVDQDFDQPSPPVGSLFIELYNPWSRDDATAGELYTVPGAATTLLPSPNAALNLSQLTPASYGTQYPVWRLLITKTDKTWDKLDPTKPVTSASPDTFSTSSDLDRAVYLTPFASGAPPATDVVSSSTIPAHFPSTYPTNPMYPTVPGTLLQPGQYAVVGPTGPTTSASITTTQAGYSPARQLSLRTTQFQMQDSTASTASPIPPYSTVATASPTIKPVLPIPIDLVSIGAGGGTTRRLSISEPDAGYANQTGTAYSPARDQPEDEARTDFPGIWSNSTLPQVRFVHLQRLADPLRPWNPTAGPGSPGNGKPANPYLTIDSMPIDLTVFNSNDPTKMEKGNPNPPSTPAQNFNARERSGLKELPPYPSQTPSSAGLPYLFNIWSQASAQCDSTNASVGETAVSGSSSPNHTLGYLNQAFILGGGQRLGSQYNLNPFGAATPYSYVGSPNTMPFASFHWPNRPFISAYELLHVPAYSSARLLALHNVNDGSSVYYVNNNAANTGSPFAQLPNATGAASLNVPPLWFDTTVFRHLMPWFVSSTGANTPGLSPFAPQIYRLFDWVHVPTRFAGADVYLNPSFFSGAATNLFQAPFNKVSRYREPGKININTIFDDGNTWRALTGGFPDNSGPATGISPFSGINLPVTGVTGDTFWNMIVRSRRGWNIGTLFPGAGGYTTAAGQLAVDQYAPTLFANPFRSSAGNFLVPLDGLRRGDADSTINPANYNYIRQGIDSTLLRCGPFNTLSAATNVPLLASYTSNQLATNTTRNSYFNYQLLTKLGNILTTRSNVYAVWITVGYFEASRIPINTGGNPAAPPAPYAPDGWQLGREMGSDTGEIQRHRAFFMIDRTIPVGFQRGEDLNVEDCFLIQRFIE